MRVANMKQVTSVVFGSLLAACVAVIPVMIQKNQNEGYSTMRFEIRGNAAGLYARSVAYSLKKNPDIRVLQDDRTAMSFVGENVKDGRRYSLKWTVKQIDDNKCRFDFEIKGSEGEKPVPANEMGRQADQAVKNFCDALQQVCEIAPAAAK